MDKVMIFIGDEHKMDISFSKHLKLTIGKKYTIYNEDIHYRKYKVIDDDGCEIWPWKSYFITIEENREIKINIYYKII